MMSMDMPGSRWITFSCIVTEPSVFYNLINCEVTAPKWSSKRHRRAHHCIAYCTGRHAGYWHAEWQGGTIMQHCLLSMWHEDVVSSHIESQLWDVRILCTWWAPYLSASSPLVGFASQRKPWSRARSLVFYFDLRLYMEQSFNLSKGRFHIGSMAARSSLGIKNYTNFRHTVNKK